MRCEPAAAAATSAATMAVREDVAPVTNNYYSGEAAKFDSACLAFFMPSGIKGTWQELPHLGGLNATS
jgi:hypothetical protein